MKLEYIDTASAAASAVEALSREPSLALDCEAAGFHRYSDRLCLVQISTPGGRDLIFDPLEVDLSPLLGPLIEDPDRRLYMHGGDYDVRLLDRDLEVRPRGIFDTQIAASLLGLDNLGLAALLDEHFGVRLSKKYQRADWARRPLDDGMLEYAAADTRYLHELASILGEQLDKAGRTAWAEEEFGYMEAIRHEPDEGGDPVTRVKRARKLGPREVTRLREALAWRDEIAREQDRAPFRVASDAVLLDAAVSPPRSAHELADRKGMNGRVARQYGRGLVERLQAVDVLSDDQLVPYPRMRGTGPGRPTPEEEELVMRLKDARNRVAEELGIDRGVLFPNASILDVVRRSPATVSDMAEMEGIRRWQTLVLGEALLEALR